MEQTLKHMTHDKESDERERITKVTGVNLLALYASQPCIQGYREKHHRPSVESRQGLMLAFEGSTDEQR